MKKRTKSIIGLSLATLACGAVAAVLPVASASAGTSETGVFKIADGASIRYQSVEGRPEGLRFIALMSEDVKNSLVGKNFGFIVSREDQFDKLEAETAEGATPDYLSMANKSTAEVAITAENIDDKIYEGEDEYAGYWCANIVINMNTQEDSSETEEDFMERTYSAVAYYEDADEPNRVYTTNRQERSIQEVGSKVYLAGDADWAEVKKTYETLGSEATPFLVAQSGKNSYKNIVRRVSDWADFGKGDYYQLTEDVLVEKVLSEDENFKGNFVATQYTETVPTGMIFDTMETNLITLSARKGSETIESASFEKSFDETKRFDEKSNGSAAITVNSVDLINNLYIGISPEFTNAYYDNLLGNGYTHVVIRYMIGKDTFITDNSANGFTLQSALNNGTSTNYTQDGTLVTKADGTVATGIWFRDTYQTDTWFERVVPLTSIAQLQSAGLFYINNFPANTSVTFYIDNIYLAKAAGESKTVEVAENSTCALTDLGIADVTDAYKATESYMANGTAVTPTDGNLSVSKGYYEASFRAYNRYGAVATKVVTTPKTKTVCLDDTAISITGAYEFNKTVISETKTMGVVCDSAGWYTTYITASSNAVYTDILLKPLYSKAYYETLQTLGYKYITIKIRFTGGKYTIDAGGSGILHGNNVTTTSGKMKTVTDNGDGTYTETAFTGAAPWSNSPNAATDVSFDLATFIANYNAEGTKLLRYFSISENKAGGNQLHISTVAVTKTGTIA